MLPNDIEPSLDRINARVRALEVQERSEVAGGVETFTVATLPAAGENGRMRFVSDGRKIGEGVGAGTGVVVYDDTVAWRRTSDDTTVVA